MEDQQLKREFAAANDAAVAAFESYKTYLDQELKPKADGEFALGSELFAKRMDYYEMVDISPDRLLEIAYTQLHKDKSALSEAARELNQSAPIEVVLKDIRAQHPTVDALIPTAKDDLGGLRAFVLEHHIATIPSDLQPQVEETPAFRRATTAAALDAPGPLERRATQAFYYVTPPDAGLAPDKIEQYLEAYSFPGLEIISAHEVWPGHFMQYLTRRAHPDWSLARKMAAFLFDYRGVGSLHRADDGRARPGRWRREIEDRPITDGVAARLPLYRGDRNAYQRQERR